MSPFTRLTCLAAAALAAASAAAQVHPNIERGLPANKAFEVGELDSINLFNGNLVVTIPLGQEFRLSSSLAYRLTLVYNSNVWDFEKRVDTSIPDPYTYT